MVLFSFLYFQGIVATKVVSVKGSKLEEKISSCTLLLHIEAETLLNLKIIEQSKL